MIFSENRFPLFGIMLKPGGVEHRSVKDRPRLAPENDAVHRGRCNRES